MTPERWHRLRDVLEPALELDPSTVPAWLDEHCPPDLRTEVEALITAGRTEHAFLDQPVDLAEAILPPGTTIGPYVIEDAIGAGGMGVVYRAKDSRLRREVAIKVLPFGTRTEAALDEARLVSSLNHPNIVTLHDVVESDRGAALVMEYVEGQTLAEMIAAGRPLTPSRGRQPGEMPVAAALAIARQIASAMAASHAAGVLHRDLKPANVMVRADGTVKVLDFGIAQSSAAAATGGVPVGTAAYMAPEQAAGGPLDARSDVYAFGAVCRELLITRAGTQTARVPPRWRAFVDRCTATDPAARFASMTEVLAALDHISTSGRPIWWAAAAVVLAVVAIALLVAAQPRGKTSSIQGFVASRLTGAPSTAVFPSISPDGTHVAYSVARSGRLHLVVHTGTDMSPRELGQEGRHPAWSPDGRELAFRSDRDGGGLFVLTLATGDVRRVARHGYLPSWSPQGHRLAFSTSEFTRVEERPTTNSQLWTLDLTSGVEHQVALDGPALDAIQPAWSPDGERLAFWSVDRGGRRRVWTVSSTGGAPVAVTGGTALDWNPAWAPDGWLHWASDRGGAMNGWRARVDTATGRVATAAEPVELPAAYAGFFSYSRDGVVAYAVRQPLSSIWRIDLEAGTAPVRLTPPALRVRHPSVSPDGQWIVAFEQERFENLVVFRSDGSGLRKLTTGDARDRGPSWSPDGQRIAFGSNRGGDYQMWVVQPDGRELKLLVSHATGTFSPIWSPDGTRLAWFTRGFVPFVSGPDGQRELARPAPNEGFRPTDWSGDQIVGLVRTPDGGRLATAVYTLTTGRYSRLNVSCDWARFIPGTRQLICAEGRRLSRVDPGTGATAEIVTLPLDISDQFDISPDGKTIYASLAEDQGEIWTAVKR